MMKRMAFGRIKSVPKLEDKLSCKHSTFKLQ